MSSTQTLLSMVRSAAGVAANNLENLKTSTTSQKRPNSPLDLSSRDVSNTPPPYKKSKVKNPPVSDVSNKASITPTVTSACKSVCSTGCTEEGQTINGWSVEDVCQFVSKIDLCKDYVEVNLVDL